MINIQALIYRILNTHRLLKNLSLLFILHLQHHNKLYRILNLSVEQFLSSLIFFSGLSNLDFLFLYFFLLALFSYVTNRVARVIFLELLWLEYFCLSLFLFLFLFLYSLLSKLFHLFIHPYFFIILFFQLLALILIIIFVISISVFKFRLLSLQQANSGFILLSIWLVIFIYSTPRYVVNFLRSNLFKKDFIIVFLLLLIFLCLFLFFFHALSIHYLLSSLFVYSYSSFLLIINFFMISTIFQRHFCFWLAFNSLRFIFQPHLCFILIFIMIQNLFRFLAFLFLDFSHCLDLYFLFFQPFILALYQIKQQLKTIQNVNLIIRQLQSRIRLQKGKQELIDRSSNK